MKTNTPFFTLSKNQCFFNLLCILGLLISCKPETNEGECEFIPRINCSTFTFSFIDPDSYENLMGVDGQPIHPDSIVITNSRRDTMYHEIFAFSDGWYTVQNFSVFQEITCFNQCQLDSAFTRTYHVYIGNGDTDTLEVHFPVRSDNYTTYYNEVSGELPNDIPENLGSGRTTFWFRKKN
ncbi:MAG: hypothetical protein CMP48_17985 [Rickettsiales bacterium]|nr:hypothetical protein [Rickettsiales bacterium]